MRTQILGVMVLLTAAGCSTVRVVQRDGCWVRQTEGFPKTFQEEMGPCARREPKWSEDRVARLVQECMAEADYRWESEALAAWTHGAPLPAQLPEQTVLRACMSDASTAVVSVNEALRKRLAEVTQDRELLRSSAQRDLEHLRATEDRMTDALGEAAKKPAPAAYATSTSSGSAATELAQSSSPAAAAPTTVSVTTPLLNAAPAPALPTTHAEYGALAPSCAPGTQRTLRPVRPGAREAIVSCERPGAHPLSEEAPRILTNPR